MDFVGFPQIFSACYHLTSIINLVLDANFNDQNNKKKQTKQVPCEPPLGRALGEEVALTTILLLSKKAMTIPRSQAGTPMSDSLVMSILWFWQLTAWIMCTVFSWLNRIKLINSIRWWLIELPFIPPYCIKSIWLSICSSNHPTTKCSVTLRKKEGNDIGLRSFFFFWVQDSSSVRANAHCLQFFLLSWSVVALAQR